MVARRNSAHPRNGTQLRRHVRRQDLLRTARRLAREAAEEGVSMNRWVVQKLCGRRVSDYPGLSGFD
ncbi:toxin-antitoxin system HicB family antitoxin [Mycobacterium saskatchewanense]|uniref:toxin-antitoxin system HicB family antitoxin n=1 Tax=Mycobacterium saskatchewanense TaxID=220927 RepID=UPI001E654E16|nr:toxin-antitoxin system HicB family antitoxin [Mycobacterium saskatchewanense]